MIRSVSVPTSSVGDVPVTLTDLGAGPAVLLLHGGGGPTTVTAFADVLAERAGVRVLVPTHPGFGGTTRPEAVSTIGALAELYSGLIEVLGLDEVTVLGNSIGGWIAAELALKEPARVRRIGVLDAVGVEVEDHPIATALTPARLAELAWFDPSKSPAANPASLPPAVRATLAGNAEALARYAGGMADPTLLGRLPAIAAPALVVWGEADRIVDVGYGRAFADAIPGAHFIVLPRTGHLPQLESPDALLDVLVPFLTE